ncbi:histidine kinase dimerization/phospho-acceptor domain-containing protein [Sphingopyxis kveilinensis]|uniref:histidine kinase dimerization/phospho-acceptor domain-containing protein n=1 Tax=Sphingopyxis kveilinensis TaxID=3114367 RepID=UPI0030D5DE0E
MIATILRQAPADRRARVTAWRQLSDILAQRGNQLGDDDIRRSLHALAVLRPQVPEAVRRDCARAIARHGRFAPLVALYANDVPAVSAAMLREVRLSESDWLALLPATNAMARSVLAGRDDLPEGVGRALAALGSASVALPQPAIAEAVEPVSAAPPKLESVAETAAPSQISELVRRIDKYQSRRSQSAPARTPRRSFCFETGPDGVIHWVEGVTRGAVIGLSIADAAFGGEPGTDAAAAGAFRQRAEIVNARMSLEGTPEEAGEWRFSALPWFDPASGQFRGYRATARRPQHNEMPYGRPEAEDPGDTIRQLIHELRSPLNAISGFGQIISGQMFGPVSQSYRTMAERIVTDAASVQSIIDDLETAARRSSPAAQEPPTEIVDVGAIVDQIEGDLAALLADQRIEMTLARAGGPFLGLASDADVRRMIGRLLTALVDICEPGGILVGQLVTESPHDDMLQLRIVRPASIRFATAADLLDPGFSPEGEAPGAAVLSLGFSLRLVDSLARAAGGRLEIGHNALTLHLPSATAKTDAELEVQQGE